MRAQGLSSCSGPFSPGLFPAGALQTPFAAAFGRGTEDAGLAPGAEVICLTSHSKEINDVLRELRACLTAPVRVSVTLPKGYFIAVQTPLSLFNQCQKMDLGLLPPVAFPVLTHHIPAAPRCAGHEFQVPRGSFPIHQG